MISRRYRIKFRLIIVAVHIYSVWPVTACPATVHWDVKGFGPECKYRCNCVGNEQCNSTTGACQSGCLHGWMGPACQYRNHAGRPTIDVNQYYSDDANSANKAIDGNVNTCSRTGNGSRTESSTQQWWKAEYQSPLYIVGLVIKIPLSDTDKFRGFLIEVGGSTDDLKTCYKHDHERDLETTIDVNCIEPMVGSMVKILLAENMTGPLALCEVEIYGGRLVSFNKPSSLNQVLEWQGLWNASYAVDGKQMGYNDDQNTESIRTCAATVEEATPAMKWWEVRLGHVYDIQGISFFGRLNSLGQYTSYTVSIGNTSSADFENIFTDVPSVNTNDYNPKSENYTSPFLGSIIRVERNASILVICEFEAFGECPLGKCGLECNITCMCSSHTTGTDKIEGTCPHGCSGRWTGTNGQCDLECSDTEWGPYCNNTCGQCRNSTSCSVSDGICTHSCIPGWQPPYCIQECGDGYYGMDCNSTCGNCKDNGVCNKEEGTCASGCQPGYKLTLCIEECDPGTYGVNCSETCGFCLHNETCDQVTGFCTSGCATGFVGATCKEQCEDGKYGENCESCGNCAGNQYCNRTSGVCHDGCAPGYEGALCKIESMTGRNDGPGAIIGSVFGVLAAVGVTVVVVIFYKRRTKRHEQTTRQNGTALFTEVTVKRETPAEKVEDVQPSENTYNDVYCNGANRQFENMIKVCDLRAYCHRTVPQPDELHADFEDLPYGLTDDVSEARDITFKPKNRYKDMYPYNKNRVKLPEIEGQPASTYINASYIKGYDESVKYIAAQGAIEATVDDIWRLVWAENISVIVMVTNCFELGKMKCIQYWSDEGTQLYGDICTEITSEEKFTDFKIRTFQCTQVDTGQERTVHQFHYTAWPDKDVPDTPLSLVQFWSKVRCHDKAKSTPWLVHCSAGVGRTGTFIALDCLYDQGKSEQQVNIKEAVFTLRQQRLNMVQTKCQYVYLHQAVTEALAPIGSVCGTNDFHNIYRTLFTENGTPTQQLQREYDALCNETWGPEQEDMFYANMSATEQKKHDGYLPENIEKSRNTTCIPDDIYRPRLGMTVDGRNDFINAVYLSTYRQKDCLILTQFPLRTTIVDFIRLMWEYDLNTVVLLDDQVPMEGVYWYSEDDCTLTAPFTAELIEERTTAHYTIRRVKYTHSKSGNSKEVCIFHLRTWLLTDKMDVNTDSVLQLITNTETMMETDKPLVVQCIDGVDRSGLFSVLCCVIERIKSDKEVAIAESVQLLRQRRSHIITNFEQYVFCYRIIRDYLDTHEEVYANVI